MASFQKRALNANASERGLIGSIAVSKLAVWLPALRLFFRIWLVVLVLTFISALAWDLQNEKIEHRAKIDASVDRVLLAWQAGADARNFPSVADIAQLGKQFILHDVILGGVIASPTGDTLASFGQLPELTWQNIHIDQILLRENPDHQTVDVTLPALETDLTYEIIVQVPGPGHPFSKLKTSISKSERIIRDLVWALMAATAVSLLMLLFVAKPHWELQRAAVKAASAKINVDSNRLRWRRKDTLGLTAKAVDALIARLHYVRESELAPLKHAFLRSGLPILKFNANGRLNDANDAAAALFEKEHPAKLKELDFMFQTIPGNERGSPVELCTQQKGGHFQGQVMLQTAGGQSKVCFADITAMASMEARKNAAVQVVLIDATDFFTRLVMREEEAIKLGNECREAKRMDLLLRRQLETFSCLANTAPVKTKEKGQDSSAFISMERLINEWYQESVMSGASRDVLEHSALEAVSGDPDTIRSIVRQCYNMLYTLSGELTPQINISSKLIRGGLAEFVIEQIPDLESKKVAIQEDLLGWTHNFDALKKLLVEANGQLLFFDATVRPVNLIIRLPAFRTDQAGVKQIAADDVAALMRKAG